MLERLHERKFFTITVYRIRQSEDFAKYIFHIYIFKRSIYSNVQLQNLGNFCKQMMKSCTRVLGGGPGGIK